MNERMTWEEIKKNTHIRMSDLLTWNIRMDREVPFGLLLSPVLKTKLEKMK